MNDIRQIRIFAPRQGVLNHALWAETMLGIIVHPVVQQFQKDLAWYWFTRYDCTAQMDEGDCDISKIPTEFMDQNTKHYRSVRFRYAIVPDKTTEFEKACLTFIDDAKCAASDFRAYSLIADLGNTRHLEDPRTPEREKERAQLVVENYFSLARICLHALRGPDQNGHFSLPHYQQQPGTPTPPFSAIHHVLCNMTDIPLFVGILQPRPFGPQNQNNQFEQHVYRVGF
jgi:hypothetical protein